MDMRGRSRKYPLDAGCKYADEFLGNKSSCLTCPFNECVFISPGGNKHRILKTKRDQEILSLISQGITEEEIAERFDIHIRTVQRAIRRNNGEKARSLRV